MLGERGVLEADDRHVVRHPAAGPPQRAEHDYGPNPFQQTWFSSSTTPASLDAVWNANWGYLYTRDIAPVWVGEFGTDNTAADVASSAAGSQGQWFESLVGYLSANPWMGWTYWALNGEDSYDLLDSNYDATPASAAKQSLLASIQFALPGAVNGTPPPPTPAITPPSPPGPRCRWASRAPGPAVMLLPPPSP